MLDQETVKSIIDRHLPSMLESLKDELKTSVTYQVKDAAAREVSTFVVEWVKANIIPEVEKALVESKAGLISLGPILAERTNIELAEAFTASLKEALKNSWDRKRVFEALLKG